LVCASVGLSFILFFGGSSKVCGCDGVCCAALKRERATADAEVKKATNGMRHHQVPTNR